MDNYKIRDAFIKHFGQAELIVFAPGRANIIGEHTDYNEGFVLPFAIDQGVWFFASVNGKDEFNIIAADTGENSTLFPHQNASLIYGWEKYFNQVLMAMAASPLKGSDIVFGGNLPIGAGISSSSAITCGFVHLLNKMNHLEMSPHKMVKIAVEAERGSGVRGGIMDQYSIFNGLKNKAVLLDCRSNSHEFVDLDLKDCHFYLINTCVKHNLINTDYNNRRAQCDEAVSLLNKYYRPIRALRDLNTDDIPKLGNLLSDTLFKRASFVIQENQRVKDAVHAIKLKNFAQLGELLYASHDGLSQLFEVSCPELDWLVDYTLDDDIFLGSRMMGGGFGGCTINLTSGELNDEKINDLSDKYYDRFGINPEIIPISPEDGILQKKTSYSH